MIDTSPEALRMHITKSRAGHYSVAVRSSTRGLVFIKDKLPTLEAARREGRAALDALAAEKEGARQRITQEERGLIADLHNGLITPQEFEVAAYERASQPAAVPPWSEEEAAKLAHRAGFAGTSWTMGPYELVHMLNMLSARPAVPAEVEVPNTFKLPGESEEAWIDRITGAVPAEGGAQTTGPCAGCDLFNGCPEYCRCKPAAEPQAPAAVADELAAFAREFLSDYRSEDDMRSMKYYAGKADLALARYEASKKGGA